ncbi:MAG: hypothetical protein ACYDHY_06965 [Acidiferrobacterales bacterium]
MSICRLIYTRFEGRRLDYGRDWDSVNDFVEIITKFPYPDTQLCFRLIDTVRTSLRNWSSLQRMNHSPAMDFYVWKRRNNGINDDLMLTDPATD